mmetsp:Transcript_8803/g.12114  ORF Transcript_8803/g.12114 Transcript_8803/m.12114 type:complete len:206 (+) Transcript_8803:2366-2983(+)
MLKTFRVKNLPSIKNHKKLPPVNYTEKKLIHNELPLSTNQRNFITETEFSNKISDICENYISISINKSTSKVFQYMLNFKNLLKWNSFIYQIGFSQNNSDIIIHSNFPFRHLPSLELTIPLKIIQKLDDQYFEFQNSSNFGMPICGRVSFISDNVNESTKLSIYLKYPLPLALKKTNINSEYFSLIIQEIITCNAQILKKCLENK